MESAQAPSDKRRKLGLLSLTALGIVYGDIGTSPLYALRESFLAEHGVSATLEANVLGVLSLIFWSLVLVISVKYLVFILRADNRGEGGILALTALVTPVGDIKNGKWLLLVLGLFGTSLLYGDGMLTPAVSVLSAVEGIRVLTPALDHWVVPITVAILAALFLLQKRGTAGVGMLFGPITLLWFIVIAVLGIVHIASYPAVLLAASPHYAIAFLTQSGFHAFLVLGSVFLVVTGGEALYADMGHFGHRPIRLMWFAVVLPALLLNYFGQGAMVILDPATVENPLFRMVPQSAVFLLPLVLIATAAAVIASQALISGAYSLTMHAVQLGYSPRVRIEHTSAELYGQIYIPGINWALMLACIGLVVSFKTSSNLTAAYGVAVTMTMTITTILFFFVARDLWKWKTGVALLVVGPFLIIDMAFLGSNLLKIPQGGWFPLVIGIIVFVMLTTWKRGRTVLAERMEQRSLPAQMFVASLATDPPLRVSGTAVFMCRKPGTTPPALLHNLKHNKALHERIIFLSIVTEDTPHISQDQSVSVESLGYGVHQLVLRYGFMEDVDIPKALSGIQIGVRGFKPLETSYFLGRETLVVTHSSRMTSWTSKLFATMSRNERTATDYFKLPPNRVVELGAQIEI